MKQTLRFFFEKFYKIILTSVSRIVPKKVKMAIYARKTLLLLLKIEGGTLGLGKNEKSHSAEKVMKRGDPLDNAPYFCEHSNFFGSLRDSKPCTPAS